MAGLSGLLDLGAAAILAQQAGVGVSGRNVSGAGVEGYSRQSIDLRADQTLGVRAGGPTRAASELLARRERSSGGAFGRADSLASATLDLDRRLAGGGRDLVQAIAALFGGLLDLASAPLDATARQSAVASATDLASHIRRSAAAIESARAEADARIAEHAERASRLAAEIAAANRALVVERDPVLEDRRDLAARELSGLVGGSARIDSDGKMRFVVGSGTVLVDGDRAASVVATPDAARGNRRAITVVDGVHVSDVTDTLDGGRLAAEVSFRDGVGAQAASDLDALAFDLATGLNAVHSANAGLDGVTGRNLFTAPAGVAGAAAALTVDAAVAADPSLLATASPGAGAGDVGGLHALLDARNAPLAGGGTRTFVDEAIRLHGSVGSAAAGAVGDRDLEGARGSALSALRDSLSGVSVEEEMTRLAAFQHAAEAATKFVGVVDGLLGHLIDNL